MKDIPKHSFEEEFRKAFEEAEAMPSTKLWAQIDAELANKEASIYKRRLYIYKLRVAAAAVVVFGFLGLWLISKPFSDSLANLPQQNNTHTTSSQNGNADIALSAPATHAETRAIPQQPKNQPANNGTGTATREPAIENLPLSEASRQAKESRSGRHALGKVEKPAASMPETIALGSKTGKIRKPLKGPAKEKSVISTTTPAIANKTNKERISTQEQTVARTVRPATSNPTFEENKNIALLPQNTHTDHIPLVGAKPVSSLSDPRQTEPAAGMFSAYTFSRIHQKIQPSETSIALQAPDVRVKPNTHVYIEEEKEKEGGKSVSRWAVGLSFVPGQFNPNMQVNPQASASLSNARNNYYGRTAPSAISTGNTLQTNTAVGNDLEKAQSVNLSYNLGVSLDYALSGKISLQSGVFYLYNNSQITTDHYLQNISNQEKYPEFMALMQPASPGRNGFALDAAPQSNYSSGPSSGFQNMELAMADKYVNSYPGVTEIMVYNTYQYLSIPLSLHYKLLDQKVSTEIGAGVAADIFMKNTIGNPDENIATQEFNRSSSGPYRDLGFSGLVSARVNYQISSRYNVYVTPSYRTALTPFTNSIIVSSRPNSFGIGTGFQYRF